jgi:hypothetical protein
MKDLFNTPELIPSNVNAIFSKYNYEIESSNIEQVLKEVESVGYTFDYGLDFIPYDLKPIHQ